MVDFEALWRSMINKRDKKWFNIKSINGGNLAFIIVVLASYVSGVTALVYSHRSVSVKDILLLVVLAVAYLIIGTYGFSICRRLGTQSAAIAYFAIQLLIAASLIWVRGSAGELSLILFPLAGQSALVLAPGLMVAVCLLVYANLMLPLILRSQWIEAVAVALAYGTGIVFVVVFTRIAASERAARAELGDANKQLREHAAQVEELATTKERNRLAREIHDGLGHYLTVVNVQIGAARAIMDRDQLRALDHLSKAQSLTQEGLSEVRRSVAALRASTVEGSPLPEALSQLAAQWNTTTTQIKFEIVGNPMSLTPQFELTLYRAAQEALTNVGKHAVASHVNLTLDYDGSKSVRLKVEDDGVGAQHYNDGFGLLGVRERAQLLGGEVRIDTGSGKGFTLEVSLPL